MPFSLKRDPRHGGRNHRTVDEEPVNSFIRPVSLRTTLGCAVRARSPARDKFRDVQALGEQGLIRMFIHTRICLCLHSHTHGKIPCGPRKGSMKTLVVTEGWIEQLKVKCAQSVIIRDVSYVALWKLLLPSLGF